MLVLSAIALNVWTDFNFQKIDVFI